MAKTVVLDYDGCKKSISAFRDKVVAGGKKIAATTKAKIEQLRGVKVTVSY